MERYKFNYISQDVINKNHYNYSCYIGRCTQLIKDCNPTTLEEWDKYYSNYMEESGLKNKLNLIIFKLSIQYNVTIEELNEVFHIRAVLNTWEGYARENNAKILIEKYTGLKLKHSTYEEDSNLGVDFKMYKGSKLVGGIQVKPLSYFLGKHEGVQRDKKINAEKYEKFKNKYGCEIIEIAIDNNEITHNIEKLKKYKNI